ncbi:MAG: excisionase family DNA-binding protein [Acidobacteria bacterium]|nr:excisionase family DNA-binding protein [Acidobacteriota bacterium]
MNDLIGTREAAVRLRISVRRVQALIAAGRLPAERVGNSFAIKETDLKFMKSRRSGRPNNDDQKAAAARRALFKRFAGAVEGLPDDLAGEHKKYLEGLGR